MSVFLSPDTELITKDIKGRTTIKEMQVKPKTIFDGIEWLESTYSSIVAHTMNMYKVTFSDGHSVIMGDDQHILMNLGGLKLKPKRLNSRAGVALGKFHKSVYKYDNDNNEPTLYNRYLNVIGVKFSHKGLAYGLKDLPKNQAVCLSNGVILQN